jgi:sugar/nucleoside kinase (ribokinase family)
MIAVTGEALIDLVTDSDGRITARPGGGPFTTARAGAPASLRRASRAAQPPG